MARTYCECGNREVALPRLGRKRSLKANRGIPVAIKGHDLCERCREAEMNPQWARKAAEKAARLDKMRAGE